LPEFAAERRLVAASYRMEQFIKPLIQDGHDIVVCGRNIYDPREGSHVSRKEHLVHYQLDRDERKFHRKVQSVHDEFMPDCVIGVGRVGAITAAKLKIKAPLWIDYFGSSMCEAQSKSYVFDDNQWAPKIWEEDEPALERGDVFSTCGRFQEHFLTGALSVLGRLNKNSFGYRFVYAIPPAISDDAVVHTSVKKLLRGSCINEDDFAILWCGGYNVWTDIDTLFQALEKAFSENDRIKFVSLGGGIENYDERTYPRFLRLAARSKFRDRFKLLGWRSYAEAVQAYSECDLGISLDKYHYEPVYGTRTRIVEMIQHRLPAITSLACELSYVLRDHDLALTFNIGDARTLAEEIVEFSRKSRDERDSLAQRAYTFFRSNYTYTKTTEPLRDWARKPVCAPDKDASKRPVLLLRSNREYLRRLFEEMPEDNIALKRLVKNKAKAKLRKLFRLKP